MNQTPPADKASINSDPSKQIDLRQAKTYVAGRLSDKERTRHMSVLCQKLGLQAKAADGIPPIEGSDQYSQAISHLRALRYAEFSTPLLVLENNCDITSVYSPLLNIPANADILYLGSSNCGFVDALNNQRVRGAAIAFGHDEHLMRVYNMAATHAVLYLSKRAIQAAIDSIIQSMVDGRPIDSGFEALQRNLYTYALRQPIFYQPSALQSTDNATKIETSSRLEFKENQPPANLHLKLRTSEEIKLSLARRPNGDYFWKLSEKTLPTQ
ncbi:MAG: hypothetical protein V7711_01195 [Pseudomonadales bacterium]